MDYGNLKVDTITTSTRTIIVDDLLVTGANVVTEVRASGVSPIQVSGGPITSSGTLQISINQSGLSIAPSQLTSGALPAGVTVASGNIIDGTIGDAEIASGASIAPSKIAGTAVVNNDARLSDQRTPLDGSVTNAKVASGAAIELSKLANGTLPSGIAIASGTSASTNISYNNATRALESSTGSGVTLPLVASGNAGLAPVPSGGTSNFLRADGTWAEVVTTTNLSYNNTTRQLSSSTGSGVTLPLATSGDPGLMASADRIKLDGIAAGAEVNVNPDWNASSGDAQILNKPTIPSLSDATPQAPGTAAAGTATSAARGDHVHALPPLVSSSTAGLAPATSYAAITYAADVELDMAALDGQLRTISLTGNLSLTSINRATGRSVVLRLICDSTQRTLTFPAGWVFVGTKPATIAASKTGILSLTFFGTADTDCVAAWGVQS